MTSSNKSSIRLGPLIAAGLLVFVGLISLLLQAHDPAAAQDDWNRAAEAAVEMSEATDGIRVHPSWSEAALPALQPVGNLLHRHHRPLLEDLLSIDRLLIVTEAKKRHDALDRLPFDATADAVHDFDTVELLEVAIPDELRVATDMTDTLRDATVGYRGADDDQPCRWSSREGAWHCDGRSQDAMIRSVLLEVENDPRRCIQAYPPAGDNFLSVEMTVAEASDVLRIRAGLDNRAARLPKGDDVVYRIFLDDELIAEEHIDGHTSKWTAHDADTSSLDGGPVDFRVEVESIAPKPHHRRFCFNAWPLTTEQAEH